MISAERAAEIKHAYIANEAARKQFDPKRHKRGGGYGPEEVLAIEKMAGVRKPTNEELAELQTFEFMTDPPTHLFAYYTNDARVGEAVTGWTGNVLGKITWRGTETRPMGGRVVGIRMQGANGASYAGKCNLSSGTYCRLKKMTEPKARPRTTKDEYTLQGNYGHGHGWEDLTTENAWSEIRDRRKEYRDNEPGTPLRIVKRRVPIAATANPISQAAEMVLFVGGAAVLAAGLYYALSPKTAAAASAQPITTDYRSITITVTQTSATVWTAQAPNPINPTNTITITANSSDAAISAMKTRIDNYYSGMTA